MNFHLAQANMARMRYPLEDPRMREFTNRIAEINQLAEASPGFIWRLQDDSGDATYIRPFTEYDLFNLSVWESPEALRNFVYQSAHAELIRGKHAWFEAPEGAYLAMWWIPAGEIPTVPDAVSRIQKLRSEGDTAEAFTFRRLYPPPVSTAAVL